MTLHPPAEMRSIVQEAKFGRPFMPLLERARAITEPAFVAQAVMALSMDPRITLREAAPLLDEVATAIAATPRLWHKFETIAECGRKAARWRPENAAAAVAHEFRQRLAQLALAVPAGGDLSTAIRTVAPWAPDRKALLASALGNGETAIADAKEVLRHGADSACVELLDAAAPPSRARLFGYLHLQGVPGALPRAMAAAAQLDPPDQVAVLRAIIPSIPAAADLYTVADAIPTDDEAAARVLATLAARADKLGDPQAAAQWFAAAALRASALPEGKLRSSIVQNIETGQARLAGAGSATHTDPVATPGPPSNQNASLDGASASMTAHQVESGPRHTKKDAASPTQTSTPSKRHWLGLYDTYDGSLKDAHIRAVARAAPLCAAFDLDLGLFGFPLADLGAFVARACAETGIGDGGRLLAQLHADGRIHAVACTTREPPANLAELGIAVATTSEPDPAKQVDFALAHARAKHNGAARIILLMGLGSRGLPQSLLRAAPCHLELTGKRISMETATAMGVMAERLRQVPPVDAGHKLGDANA